MQENRSTLLLKNRDCKADMDDRLRILHVVGGMNRGGIETWLMHILRHIDRDRFQMDFLVHTKDPCAYDDEIHNLGSKIIPCLNPSRPWLYAHNFKRILREFGPYDIVHSHVHHFSGYVLRLAQKAGIPLCIAHSHIDSSPLEAQTGLHRRLYLTLMKALITRHATVGLGCSQLATLDLFSPICDHRWRLLYYGIDMTPFGRFINAVNVRAEFGIPANAFVIGHVGRFQKQKNHRFLLEIFAEVVKREPKAYLLLVGEGFLRPNIEQQALQMGLSNQIIFAGNQSDVPKLMMGVLDMFLLPSLSEGLPMVGIEAQTAGLPLILSDVITEEVDVVKPLVRRLSLSQSASEWAEVLLAHRNAASILPQLDTLALMKKSQFSIQTSMQQLQNIYQTALIREAV